MDDSPNVYTNEPVQTIKSIFEKMRGEKLCTALEKKVVGTTYVANMKGIRLVKVADEQDWSHEKRLFGKRTQELKEGKEAVYLWEEVKAVAFSKP